MGLPLLANVVSDDLYRITKKAKLPRLRFHDLRHSAATILRDEGVPLDVISKRLSHRSVSITSKVYAHWTRKADETAKNAMDRALGKKSRTAVLPADTTAAVE